MDIKQHIPLAPYTTFHIGGPADYFITVFSTEELVAAVAYAKEKKIPFFVLGTGANVLVGDNGFRGLVIKNEAHKFQISNFKFPISNDQEKKNISVLLTAESGVVIGDLIEETAKMGLSGLEHFAGIPSTLGGALWQNLHFLSPDRQSTVFIADIVESANVLLESGEVQQVDRSYFHFEYDYSVLHERKDVVLSASLVLQEKDPEVIRKTIIANQQWRDAKHPEDAWKKSAGSVFKKIDGYGAGRLIEQAGLKGKRIGGAEISMTHANFILNTGNATAGDVRELISLVQEKVKEQTSLHLEPEISFVGEF